MDSSRQGLVAWAQRRLAALSHPAGADLTDVTAMRSGARWGSWAGGLLAIGLSAAALLQLRGASAEAFAMLQGLSPAVWAVFVALYLAQPLADLVIFRRLWRLPFTGLRVVLRKVVINEVLFGYSGELYFYIWARRKVGLSHAPFGAIKDVNILSAVAGNIMTLIMLPISAIGATRVDLTRELGPVLWPGLALVALTFSVLLFSRRVFSLNRQELTYVATVHGVRLAAASTLTLWLWSLALPGVALGLWLVLLTSRLLLTRLPFIANKDLVFANLVLVLFGAASPIALVLATLALITLLTHLAVTVLVSLPDLLAYGRGGHRFGAGNAPDSKTRAS